ncbi:MFS transporter [Agrococcus casei]|uniref:MFS transporter n=1 Tax=Agrococcus casei TaxID=343512 RepID=UPI003F92842C
MTSPSPASQPWEGHPRGSREYRRILVALLFAGIATFAQVYSPQGILPEIAESLSVSPDQSALLISATTLGLAAGVIPWSWAADRIGRIAAMRWSLVAAVVCGLAAALMPTFELIVAFRTVEGLALAGLPAIAVTYLQEEVRREHSALAAGTYVSGTTIGGLLGRIVAAPIAHEWDWRAGVATVVIIAAASTAVFIVLTPTPQGFRRHARGTGASLFRLVTRHLRSRVMLALFAQAFLLMGGFVTVYNYLAFHLRDEPFSLSPTITSLLFFAYLAGTWSSRKAGSLADRVGRFPALLIATAVMGGGLALTLASHIAWILIGLVLFTLGFFAAHAVATGWTSYAASTGRSQATSLYNLFYYLGSSVVGWAGGLVFLAIGWPGTVLGVGALLVGAMAIAALALRPTRESQQ